MTTAMKTIGVEDVAPGLKGAVAKQRHAGERYEKLVREGERRVAKNVQTSASEYRETREATDELGRAQAEVQDLMRDAKPAAGRAWLEENAAAIAKMAVSWASSLEPYAAVLVSYRESIRRGAYLPTFKIMPQSKIAELDELRTFVLAHGIATAALPLGVRSWCEGAAS